MLSPAGQVPSTAQDADVEPSCSIQPEEKEVGSTHTDNSSGLARSTISAKTAVRQKSIPNTVSGLLIPNHEGLLGWPVRLVVVVLAQHTDAQHTTPYGCATHICTKPRTAGNDR